MAAWADAGATGSTLLYLLKQVELAVRSDLDEITRPAGLTALQHTALTVLDQHPDLTSAHLARHSFVTAQSLADMVTVLLDQHPDLTSAHGATRPTVVAWSSS